MTTPKLVQMRYSAGQYGKFVPSLEDLENLVAQCGMVCYGCDILMVWTREESQPRCATLQHDRDGTIRIICLSCNSRHQHYPGDSFYQRDRNLLRCGACHLEKPPDDFYLSTTHRTGFNTRCTKCQKEAYETRRGSILARHARYREDNREKVRRQGANYYKEHREARKEQMREYRRRVKADGHPTT